MNRRDFFQWLFALFGLFTLDPERLLWRPTKTIFIPPVPKDIAMVVPAGDAFGLEMFRDSPALAQLRLRQAARARELSEHGIWARMEIPAHLLELQ